MPEPRVGGPKSSVEAADTAGLGVGAEAGVGAAAVGGAAQADAAAAVEGVKGGVGDSLGAPGVAIRRAGPADGAALGDVWLASWRATFDFPPGHPDDDVRNWLATELLPTRETWVASDPDNRVVALMALSEAMIDQLYVAPDRIGKGIGGLLVAHAKVRRPDGLDLFCFAVNTRAQAFYEHRGFVEIGRGDGSGNEERQPDIRYAWRPDR